MVTKLTVKILAEDGTLSRTWTATVSSNEVIECDECGAESGVWHFNSDHADETGVIFFCLPCLRADRSWTGEIIWDY